MLTKFISRRLIFYTLALFVICVLVSLNLLLRSQILVIDSNAEVPTEIIASFPISVDPDSKTIISNEDLLESFYTEALATNSQSENNWWNKVAAVLVDKSWYQNLASSVSRIVVIWPGERKEEVAKHIGDILRWSNTDRQEFMRLMDAEKPVLKEGKYFPGQYVTHRHATPEDIHTLIYSSFMNEVLDRYSDEVASVVPLEDALTIASLIEREASDFDNMREVSGVIWNRLFIDMPLQLDATLQYARGSDYRESEWWPKPVPRDKFIDSAYNTYQNAGLPPAPIANPSAESILAALNPVVTDCLFYFHRNNGDYHCSITYEEHVEKLRDFYGQGS